jgi:hypothetical protein
VFASALAAAVVALTHTTTLRIRNPIATSTAATAWTAHGRRSSDSEEVSSHVQPPQAGQLAPHARRGKQTGANAIVGEVEPSALAIPCLRRQQKQQRRQMPGPLEPIAAQADVDQRRSMRLRCRDPRRWEGRQVAPGEPKGSDRQWRHCHCRCHRSGGTHSAASAAPPATRGRRMSASLSQ